MDEFEKFNRQLLESVLNDFVGIKSRRLSIQNLERRLARYTLNDRLQNRLNQLALRAGD